ncbi:methylated-DNA-[protein]-cysteine S-methyltransferase [Christiangramia gaetbulicola]|uniref:Methylated-DNA--protein-cysteine methyltransferase n=1 Tax=Christiangramia gaetbulicola TaxID=703340 RepID=A0A2T6AMR3_9FLAO|nr:methylated-DNA--[protein]-cysteine S-methyltransferase [Christiangramia gaetbulicola]PTX45108.1 methylated-DNA-[protein]-cysteine S-methyltransferase [Christiangramia gaetbulicola]
MKKARIKTPLGIAELTGDSYGLASVKVLDEGIVSAEIPSELQEPASQLEAYFQGILKSFDLKLNPQGTDFQKKVWKKLLEIPYGTTTSYLQLSKDLGDKKAIRAVASANGKNPLWFIVPCHRVIGSDGSLTGYAGGLQRKKWLLDMENPPSQQSLF